MNCWEVLGIDPTRDRAAIDRAYEQQKKFADGEELDRLHQAYREASGEAPEEMAGSEPVSEGQASPEPQHQPEPKAAPGAELNAEEQQIVREVVIQVKALLNDSRRAADEGIWRAILAEPPADQDHLRDAIARSLEQQVRPMADNGSFPPAVVAFLADWFGWRELESGRQPEPADQTFDREHESRESSFEDDSQPPVTNFWPAVIGWVVALVVLATFFDSIFGG